MPANFTPTISGITQLSEFKIWCQKTLPLVYDDSLSYYEVLCKTTDYINKIINNENVILENQENLINAYNQLQEYVNTYFDNLDVQEEINNKLDQMASDGTLSNLLEPFLSNFQDDVSNLQNSMSTLTQQVNNLIANPPTTNTEVQDIRTPWYGENYDTAGDAVRGQFSKLNLGKWPLVTSADLRYANNTLWIDPRLFKSFKVYNMQEGDSVQLRTISTITNVFSLDFNLSTGTQTVSTILDFNNPMIIRAGTIGDRYAIVELDQTYFSDNISNSSLIDPICFERGLSVYDVVSVEESAVNITVNDIYLYYLSRADSTGTAHFQIMIDGVRYSFPFTDGMSITEPQYVTINNPTVGYIKFKVDFPNCNFIVTNLTANDYPFKFDYSDNQIILGNKWYFNQATETIFYPDNIMLNSRYNDWNAIFPIGSPFSVFRENSFRKPISVSGATATGYLLSNHYEYNTLVQYNPAITYLWPGTTTGKEITALVIGDSITRIGEYLDKANTLINASDFDVNFIGNYETTTGVKNEGRGSWTAGNYVNDSSYAGSTNFFWNPNSNAFDFSYYMSTYGFNKPDIVFINLGTNDASATDFDPATTIGYYNAIIQSILDYDSNIKIGLWLCPPPNKYFYSAINNQKNIFLLHQALIAEYDDTHFIIPVNLFVDGVSGFDNQNVPRSMYTTETTVLATQPHHFNQAGNYQLGDAFFNFIAYYVGSLPNE